MEKNMKFGNFLRQQRDDKNWTQPEAASKIEIEQSYLSKLETGKSYPSEEIFTRLVEVYEFDTQNLNHVLFPAELDKLREIKQVRQSVLNQEKTATTFTRSWLLSGLICLMISGLMMGVAISNSTAQSEYYYRSEGVILDGEELNVFQLVHEQPDTLQGNPELDKKRAELLARLEQRDEITTTYRGDAFVKKVIGGKRFFKSFDQKEISSNENQKWFLAFGFMFFCGGLSSFFVSRYWK
jgi:transcriptional regulator with XRE-family HTH domain